MQLGNYKQRNGRVWAGLFLTGVGAILLLKQIGISFPFWFFTWPMFLMGLGLFLGLKHGFKGPSWIILILIGVIFLADLIQPELDLRKFAIPAAFIGFGLMMLFRSKKLNDDGELRRDFKLRLNESSASTDQTTNFVNPVIPAISQGPENKHEDFIDSVAIFGGVSKMVVSKDFKGGDLVAIFGGNEINLSQADIQNPVVIDFVQIMGGSKLIVPAHWEIRSEMVSIFGGIEDKRKSYVTAADPNKVVLLRGTSIFGGIEISNY